MDNINAIATIEYLEKRITSIEETVESLSRANPSKGVSLQIHRLERLQKHYEEIRNNLEDVVIDRVSEVIKNHAMDKQTLNK